MKDPFASDNVSVFGAPDDDPGLGSFERVEFLSDGDVPLWPVFSSFGFVKRGGVETFGFGRGGDEGVLNLSYVGLELAHARRHTISPTRHMVRMDHAGLDFLDVACGLFDSWLAGLSKGRVLRRLGFEFGFEFGLGIRRVFSLALASRLLPLERKRLQSRNEDLLGCLSDAAFDGDRVLAWPVDAMRTAVSVQAHPLPKHSTSAQLVACRVMHPDVRTQMCAPQLKIRERSGFRL